MDMRDKPLPFYGQTVETEPKPDASPDPAETKPKLESSGPEAPTNKPEVAASRRQLGGDFGGEPPDTLVPDPRVWQELGVTPMTGWRYTRDPKLNFPPPIKIRN